MRRRRNCAPRCATSAPRSTPTTRRLRPGHIKKELGDRGYPPDLKSLYAGVEDAASEKKVNLYFLRRVPRDPFFPDANVAAEDTWGLRSYQSPPDDPQPGEDVFDVYSLAQAPRA